MKEHAVVPQDITGLHAVISPLNRMLCEPVETKRRPATVIDAKFSLPFVTATALLRGQVTLDDLDPPALSQNDVIDENEEE